MLAAAWGTLGGIGDQAGHRFAGFGDDDLFAGRDALEEPGEVGFGLVDGVAAYARLADWDWFQVGVMRRYYSFALAVGLANTIIYLAYVAIL